MTEDRKPTKEELQIAAAVHSLSAEQKKQFLEYLKQLQAQEAGQCRS